MKPKIAYISRSLFPSTTANSINVMKMCEAFARAGHNVNLVGLIARPMTSLYDVFSYYGIKTPFRVYSVTMSKGMEVKADYIFRSVMIARLINPDLVYTRVLEAALLASSIGLPTIFEAHKMPRTILSKASARLLFKMPRFLRLVTITKHLADKFAKNYGITPSKIVVAHDGADLPEKTGFACPFDKSEKFFHVGYVGHIYPGKGMEIIVELAKTIQWAMFHIVGGRPQDVAFWKKKTNGLDNVHFYGFVRPHRTQAFREHFDVVLAPYLRNISNCTKNFDTEWNISPLKLFEYMASGCTIVASDLPSIREVITSGVHGILIPPEDIPVWVEVLNYLRENPDVRRRLGINAKQLFLKNYTWDRRAFRVLEGIP